MVKFVNQSSSELKAVKFSDLPTEILAKNVPP